MRACICDAFCLIFCYLCLFPPVLFCLVRAFKRSCFAFCCSLESLALRSTACIMPCSFCLRIDFVTQFVVFCVRCLRVTCTKSGQRALCDVFIVYKFSSLIYTILERKLVLFQYIYIIATTQSNAAFNREKPSAGGCSQFRSSYVHPSAPSITWNVYAYRLLSLVFFSLLCNTLP